MLDLNSVVIICIILSCNFVFYGFIAHFFHCMCFSCIRYSLCVRFFHFCAISHQLFPFPARLSGKSAFSCLPNHILIPDSFSNTCFFPF